MTVRIVVPGHPQGKGRVRITRGGHAYTPEKTRSYEALIATIAMQAVGDTPPFPREVPLRCDVVAWCPIPASWSKRKQGEALAGILKPVGRPDADNIVKNLDSLNGIVWADDAAVVECSVSKRYSAQPRLEIEVSTA